MRINLRTIANTIALALLLAASYVVFIQLIPIHRSMAIDMPHGLVCDFYGASRYRGWGCTRLGDVFSQPLPTVLSLLVGAASLVVLHRGPLTGNPLPTILALQLCFPFALSILVRAAYFVEGHASNSYAVWTLFHVSVCAIGIFLAWRFRPNPSLQGTLRDKAAQRL